MPKTTDREATVALLERAAVDYAEALTDSEVEQMLERFRLHVLVADVAVSTSNVHGSGLTGTTYLQAGGIVPAWVPADQVAGFVRSGSALPVEVPVRVIRTIRAGVRFPKAVSGE